MNLFKKNTKKDLGKNDSRGFTLIETLVAIFIMAVVVTGPVSFAQSGLRAAFLARDQVTAFYLAQDAIETIKNERDNNILEGGDRDWLVGFNSCVSGTANHACRIDTATSSISPSDCGGNDCPPLKFDDTTKKFGYGSTGSPSKYIRNIYMDEVVDNQELQIVVEIKWTSGFLATERRIIVQENIYNWIGNF